ncbi:hypothetical protein M0805_008565 [Coniferiporia weirii]|nr:hypothetical protein M0805_008565 [Coniferiporia weirii]
MYNYGEEIRRIEKEFDHSKFDTLKTLMEVGQSSSSWSSRRSGNRKSSNRGMPSASTSALDPVDEEVFSRPDVQDVMVELGFRPDPYILLDHPFVAEVCRDTKRYYVKFLCPDRDGEFRILSFLSRFDTPHNPVVREIAFRAVNDGMLVVLPDGGTKVTLYENLSHDLLSVSWQLFEGVAFLHEKEVAHNDLKPSNIIVDKTTGRVSIIDFNLGVLRVDRLDGRFIGTKGWTAPEVGVLSRTIRSSHREFLKGLSKNLMSSDPKKRPSMKDAVKCIKNYIENANAKPLRTEDMANWPSILYHGVAQDSRCLFLEYINAKGYLTSARCESITEALQPERRFEAILKLEVSEIYCVLSCKMRLLRSICTLIVFVGIASAVANARKQVVLSSNEAAPGEIKTLELSSVSSNEFTTFSHPAFPGRNARIKKSNFCDGGVNSYTGYIDSGSKHFFFYFFESRNDPDNDDVLLWTNGGPGGSSAMGLFLELGPCSIASANSTKYNSYSWNTNANIFFIDQPIGVGFSYDDFGNIPSTSEEAGVDIAAFAAIFFETFSKFKGRNFHLTGESYAGRYLPVYAAAIYDQNKALVAKGLTPVNLKSVMIGNGATDFFYLLESYYDIQCTSAAIEPIQPISTCVRMKQVLPRCKKWSKTACVDHFDLIDCKAAFDFCATELMMPLSAAGYNNYDVSMKCGTNTSCYPEEDDVAEYLNSPPVRSALGIDAAFGNFSEHSRTVNQRFWASGDPMHQTQLYIAELLARGVKVLIYAGTYDFIANWVGNERWTLDMEWEGREAFVQEELRDWLVGGAPAGKTRTSGNFTFATIYGAGHLVPHDKPIESLEMVNRWLAEESL